MTSRKLFVIVSLTAITTISTVFVLQHVFHFFPTSQATVEVQIKPTVYWIDDSEETDLAQPPAWDARKGVYFPPLYKKLGPAQNTDGLKFLPYKPIRLHDSMNDLQIVDMIQILTKQTQILCTKWRMYGRKTDGGWPVCLSKEILPTPPCVVYSFGIQNDWSFDDEYHKQHNCTIRTFDPSMSTPLHEHSPGVFFYPLGLSNKAHTSSEGWKMNSFKQILVTFKEETVTIPYLKFDIETHEFDVLHNMVADGVLKNVVQLSFEIHLHAPFSTEHLQSMFNAIKALESLGFRRWFYHQRLNGFPYQCDQSFININYLNQSRVHID